MNTRIWQTDRFEIALDKPKIMGIVNLAPDSLSDGDIYSQNVLIALAHAEQLLKDGAGILDIGGESARPGSSGVSFEEEWARVRQVLAEVAKWNVPVSLSVRHTTIMEKALAQGGVDIIDDVAALGDEGAVALLVQQPTTGMCLMHMQGLPKTMQLNPQYQDIVEEVVRYLKARAAKCVRAGIAPERIMLDPSFGFGKNLQHNITLIQHLPELMEATGFPLLIGISRKSMIGELTDEQDAVKRVHGSVAVALTTIVRGAQIIRVHDVRATAGTLKVWETVGVSV